nr:hypothetical protein [Tanacetum cinerariifolium]
PATSEKEMELWVELKRLYEPDPEDQLRAKTQNYMHAPIEWKLYDLSEVHHVTAKDKEILMLVEKDYPLKKGLALVMISYKLQEQLEREDQRRSNEVTSKHLAEYDQAAADLTIGEIIELINELVKYQDHHSKILQYQAQQRKLRNKKQKRDFYMAVIKNNLGWKAKDFKGMSFKEMEAKFKTVWEQIEGGVSKISKGEAAWLKRKGIRSEQKNLLKHLDRDDLNQLWSLVKETLSNRPPTSDKEMELWSASTDLRRQRYFHACGEGISPKEGSGTCDDLLQASSGELFTDGRKFGSEDIQHCKFSMIARSKMNKSFSLPAIKFLLPEELPTASKDGSYCQKKRDATARKIALLSM